MRKTKDLVTGLAGMGLAIFYLLSAQSIAFFKAPAQRRSTPERFPCFGESAWHF